MRRAHAETCETDLTESFINWDARTRSLRKTVPIPSEFERVLTRRGIWQVAFVGRFPACLVRFKSGSSLCDHRGERVGDDADTGAAVCGALAGAYYGYASIPDRWRTQLKDEARIRDIALALAGYKGKSLTN